MPDDCYAKIGRGTFGPMSIAKLKELAEQGDIKANTPIRRGKQGEWIEAGRIKGLKFLFETTRDVPQLLTEFDDEEFEVGGSQNQSRMRTPSVLFIVGGVLAASGFVMMFACCFAASFVPTSGTVPKSAHSPKHDVQPPLPPTDKQSTQNLDDRVNLGVWMDTLIDSRITIYRQNGNVHLSIGFNRGRDFNKRLTETRTADGQLRFNLNNATGDYYVIDENGDLKAYDRAGLVATHSPVR